MTDGKIAYYTLCQRGIMNIAVRRWSTLSESDKKRLLSRSEGDIADVEEAAKEIVRCVEREGDEAVRKFTARFDGANIDGLSLLVSESEYERADSLLGTEIKEAIITAVDNVKRFHRLQRPQGMQMVETIEGLYAGERATPIPSVGLYVPRGKGCFPSML